MLLRRRLTLPEGYRAEETSVLRLYDPQGTLLLEEPGDPFAPLTIEACAWRDVWDQVELELKDDLAALHEGTRPIHQLHRLRQYMRMLDAVDQPPVAVREPSRRRNAVAWVALAASAAALALVILSTPLEVTRIPERSSTLTPTLPGAARLSARPPAAPPLSSRLPRLARPTGPSAEQPATIGYVVTFGEFASRTAAEIRMHLIRGKGYIVYVARVGDSLHVVTRPYRTWVQAERLANALQEIGLPARARIARIGELLRARGDS